MDKPVVESRLITIIRETFNDPNLELRDDLTAAEVDGWDSLTHINLIVAVESDFGIRLTTADVRGLRNVGDFVNIIATKAK
jgi:acyl carrier protein